MTKLSNNFGMVIPNLGPPIAVLSPGMAPDLQDVFDKPMKAIQEQLTHLTDIGMGKLATAITNMLPQESNTMLPAPQNLMKGLTDPITQGTIIQLWFNRSFGSTSGARINVVKHYLTLGLNESGLNSHSTVRTSVMYKGKPTPTYARGQLQFITSTYRSGILMGSALLAKDRVLSLMQTIFLKSYASRGFKWQPYSNDPGFDPNQILANVGQIYTLLAKVDKEWLWTPNGWEIIQSPSRECNASVILRTYPKILKSYELGLQLLMSFYHINGTGALYSTTMSHVSRLAEDVTTYYNLGRIPSLSLLLAKALPVEPSLLTPEQGDPDDPIDGESGIVSGLHINEFIKRLYNFVFHHYAKGDGEISSKFGHVRTLVDEDTGVKSTHAHGGVDLRAVKGQPVFALTDGVVKRSENQGKLSFGNVVEIEPLSDKGLLLYGHLSERLVEKNAQVKKGDIIGFAGSTGFSTGPHLHVQWNPVSSKGIKGKPTDIPSSFGAVTYTINAKGT